MDFVVAFVVLFVLTIAAAYVIDTLGEATAFLKKLFFGALLARVITACAIYLFGLADFLGPDWATYDYFGNALANLGFRASDNLGGRLLTSQSGWGMYYFVAAVYSVVGQNPLVLQFINCVAGAVVCVLVYYISGAIYKNREVSERAALLTAYFPSMILWSAQGLKDELILLAICCMVYVSLRLRDRITPRLLIVLAASSLTLYSLRFYSFYIMIAAVGASLLLGSMKGARGFVRQAAFLLAVGGVLLYFGVGEQVAEHYEATSLREIQANRAWQSYAAQSSFGDDVDVRREGAVPVAIAIGITYLVLAPFPWDMTNLRQAITLPEMLVWWSLIPMLVVGLKYTIRYRLADSSAVLLFSAGLLVTYGLFLSNVGTAYRQRSQVLIFFFIFISVGLTLRAIQRQESRARAERRPGPVRETAAEY